LDRKKKLNENRTITSLEEQISILTKQSWEGVLNSEGRKCLKALEQERNKLFFEEEARWRLKSRALWIKSGDNNTKYFHHFASYRRNNFFLWEIKDDQGNVHQGHEALKGEAKRFFSSFYQEPAENLIVDQVETVRLYPRLVSDEELASLEKLVSEKEVLEVLKGFPKDKSSGPDGWNVDFFLHFFDLVAKDLLEVVEETRITGMVIRSLNSTFIALIPKVNGPTNFGDFRLIAFNLCYKVISKIIAKRLRPILSHSLSEEQFIFLKGRQIIDAIGIAQECIHSIKEKKQQALILKIDLRKAYDCISWDFLRMVLLQCGFGLSTKNWIMGCISSAHFAILVNGEPS
jgi:hypothetical protein